MRKSVLFVKYLLPWPPVTGAIRRHPDANVKGLVVNEEKCMYCGNCFTVCPAMPLADGAGDGVAIYVGGKVSNARSAPKFFQIGHTVPTE